MSEPNQDYNPEIGAMHLSDDVVATIAGMAAMDVAGISLSAGLMGGLAEKLGRKDVAKGIKVELKEKEQLIGINAFINVDYERRIPEVVNDLQRKVKAAVETKTGWTVTRVDVHVQGIILPKPPEPVVEVEEAPVPVEE